MVKNKGNKKNQHCECGTPVHYRMYKSISGLYTLDTSSNKLSFQNVTTKLSPGNRYELWLAWWLRR